LLPSLGLFTTVMLVIGGVIGSGIFRKPGIMAGQVGSPELLLFVWLLAGIITLFGALTNAEIAALIPETCGQYVYFEKMYGPFVGFLYGWAVFVVMQTGSIAAVAYVFAEYTTQFVRLPEFAPAIAGWSFHVPLIGDLTPLSEIGTKGVAALLVLLLTAANYFGVKCGGLIQNIFTIAKVAAMGFLLAGAFFLAQGGSLSNLTPRETAVHLGGLGLVAGIAAALQGAFWAYDGWNKITYIAGEVREPQRTIPRALLLGMLIVTGIYLLMNVGYAYVLPIHEMAQSKLVAADVANRCVAGGGRWIAAAVMLSTFGTANAIILASARVYFSMARRGLFPQAMASVHPRFRTPAASLIVQGAWSVLLLFSGTFDTLTDMLIFVSWAFYAAGAYGLFVLRRKHPAAYRPYRVPGYPIVPWVFVVFSLLYLALTVMNDLAAARAALAAGRPMLINSALGTALVLLGTPVYFFYRARRNRVPSARNTNSSS
jgi:APA family basic amino acid/polyamine antiporter